jgi:putative membrane-bound dehydrogenase-like protein
MVSRVEFSSARHRKGRGSAIVGLMAFVTSLAHQGVRGEEAPPKSTDNRLKVVLFAEHPQIVTPTGLDIDPQGRVWAIESNTHFPPDGYKGHPTDRLLILQDKDGDGRADDVSVFADGFTHAMSVAVGRVGKAATNKDGGETKAAAGKDSVAGATYAFHSSYPSHASSAFVATRREILLVVDDDADGKADRREQIVHLETAGNYPHNGLAGFAFDGMGWMYFGFGENLGADYKVIGSDGTTLSGGGEGGNVYRCRPDGKELTQVATGFWNPHASCIDGFGRLFTVDNDPDSRPPCRLLHAIPNGDYGYRFRNGRKGLHPFTAWNGEIPGTLPMVAGTGEAPSGILAYESDGLPEEYRGTLLGTSWGDHRIERFKLSPRGGSFQSLAEPIITGGENFRPVGIATAPDGSLYFTDWVSREYKLHGKGRIWRISQIEKPMRGDDANILDLLGRTTTGDAWKPLLESPRLDARRIAARSLAALPAGRQTLVDTLKNPKASSRAKVESLWALLSVAPPANASREDLLALGVFKPKDVVSTAAAWQIGQPGLTLDTAAVRKLTSETLGLLLSEDADIAIDRGYILPLLARTSWSDGDRLVPVALSVRDPFVVGTMVPALGAKLTSDEFAQYLNPGAGTAVEIARAMVLAARRHDPKDSTLAILCLNHPEPDVKRLAVQWVAEEKMTDLKKQLEAVLNQGSITSDLLLATLAGLELLDGVNPAAFDQTPASKYVIGILKDEKRPAGLQAQVLRLVAPSASELTIDLYKRFLASSNARLRIEAVRTLSASTLPEAGKILSSIASDAKEDKTLRGEAAVGLAFALARPADAEGAAATVTALMKSDDPALRNDALRAARGPAVNSKVLRDAVAEAASALPPMGTRPTDADRDLAEEIALALQGTDAEIPERVSKLKPKRPATKPDWMAAVAKGRAVDVEAGRRLFYHPNGPGCFKCHTIDGRGGKIGPDLTNVVRTLNRPQIIESILEPSREIAPQYVSWTLSMRDGKVYTGMIVQENEGRLTLGTNEGKTVELKTAEVEERVLQKASVMPEKLFDRMTLQEFRDLLAFLDAAK